MLQEKIRFLEEVAANGHVALNMMQYDGWLLRFSEGYTNRANSVSVIYPSVIPPGEKIACVEKCYAKHGLPSVFKVTDIDTELNSILENSGYLQVTPTDVMELPLENTDFGDFMTDCIFTSDPKEWLPYYFRYEKIGDEGKQDIFRRMLSKVTVDTVYVSVLNEGLPVACASAAIDRGFALIQNVIVSEEVRGRGLGEKLCRALIAKVKEQGAGHAFLQVVRSNEIALNLYKKLGFKKVYTYWYMKKVIVGAER